MKHYFHEGKSLLVAVFGLIISCAMMIIAFFNSWYFATLISIFFLSGSTLAVLSPRTWSLYADASVIVWSNTRKLQFIHTDSIESLAISTGDPGSVILKLKDGTSQRIPEDCCGTLKIFGNCLAELNPQMKIIFE